MFSQRVPTNLEPNALAQALSAHKRAGRPLLDLTASNPTQAGFAYPDALLAPLAACEGLVYAPAPFGLTEARAAVAADYARRQIQIGLEDIALTASTSEGYSILFKLLCDPGDEVLIPRPSYPLFDHLTRLDAVTAIPYDLEYHGRWTIDIATIEAACTARTRVLLLVSPNNPTGNYVSAEEMSALARLCADRHVAIVADEVFADYELIPGAAAAAGRLVDRDDVLGCTLGGLSKSIGLPQAKLAWIVLSGPEHLRQSARERLELIADTYLSISTPVQLAAASLLREGRRIRGQIQQRISCNLSEVRAQVTRVPACSVLNAEAGWSAVLRVPSLVSEEELILSLMAEDNVLTHPGYFFDFQTESFLIVSLLTPESDFSEGIRRILRRFSERAAP